MASDLETITAAVIAALKTVNATGVYTYDLSGDDRVVLDRAIEPARPSSVANVAVYPGQMSTGRQGVPQGYHQRTMTWELYGLIRPDAETAEARVYAGMRLLDDICVALETGEANCLGTSIPLQLQIEGEAFGGSTSDGADSVAIVNATLTIKWRVRSGA